MYEKVGVHYLGTGGPLGMPSLSSTSYTTSNSTLPPTKSLSTRLTR